MRVVIISGCHCRLSPDQTCCGRSNKNCIHNPFRGLLLYLPFGLKNGGVTHQRTIQRCTHTQLGRNLHVYVDDLVVKSVKGITLLDDLRETFGNLCTYQIKLNPEKCVFGVPADKLLVFLVSEREIECNPEKIAAIEQMEQPKNLKQVQKFTGCLASLSRSLSRRGKKAIPLYQLMKKTEKFTWTP